MGSSACAWIYVTVCTMVPRQSPSASRTVSSSKRNGPDFFVELEPDVTHDKNLEKMLNFDIQVLTRVQKFLCVLSTNQVVTEQGL